MTKKESIKTVAGELLKIQSQVTTLEIKEKLRLDYPFIYWTQDEVSLVMMEIEQAQDIKHLTHIDNGTYRYYFIDDTHSTQANFAKFVNDDLFDPNPIPIVVPQTTQSATVKMPKTSYTLKISATSTLTTSKLDEALEMVKSLSLPYYYSASKGVFLHVVEDMDPQHVFNAIQKQWRGIKTKDELKSLLDSPLVTALINSK